MISELYSVFSEMDLFHKFFFCFDLFILALFACWFFIDLMRISPEEAEEAEEKKRIEKQVEEEKLKIEAEERIRAQSQIWVIE